MIVEFEATIPNYIFSLQYSQVTSKNEKSGYVKK